MLQAGARALENGGAWTSGHTTTRFLRSPCTYTVLKRLGVSQADRHYQELIAAIRQDMDAFETAFGVRLDHRTPLKPGLQLLNNFIGNDTKRVWANGPSFDLVILRDAFKGIHMKPIWHFRQERCMRTIMDEAREIGATKADLPELPKGTKHDALDDAVRQAILVSTAHRCIAGIRGTA